MSIYSALSIDVPVIAYSALHQMKKGAGEKEYVKTIHDLHTMLRAETAAVADVWNNHLKEITASSIQTMRGNLSQFLTLPLDTDVKEIHRILEDQIGHVLSQALPAAQLGVFASTEGRFFWEREQNAQLQAMLARGKDHLRKIKFRTKEEDHFIFESDFFVESGLNLDIIEHIVRDRIGIYARGHGQHIRQSDPFVFAAHNLVHVTGTLESGDSKYESVIHFTKGRVQYAPFRKGLTELLESVHGELGLPHCSLWQRKLGLGVGTEFHIRMRARDRKLVRDSVLEFMKGAEKNPLYSTIVNKGYLVTKELTR